MFTNSILNNFTQQSMDRIHKLETKEWIKVIGHMHDLREYNTSINQYKITNNVSIIQIIKYTILKIIETEPFSAI